jgi:carboxylesterase
MRPVTAPILPGAEPFSQAGGPSGVLVLHGFTGNPQSMRPLAEAFAAAGYTVDLPLLPGHGTAVEDMIPTRWADWSEAAESAYAKLAAACDEVAVAALSVGGTLACWLAEHHPEIRGLALVNPFIDPPAESFRDVMRGVLESGTEIAPGVGSDIKKDGIAELAYLGTPIAAALSLFEGIDATAADLARISCSVLLLSSRNDHVVPSSSGDVLVAGVAGPVERVWLEESYHVATLDNDADELTARALAFVAGVLS